MRRLFPHLLLCLLTLLTVIPTVSGQDDDPTTTPQATLELDLATNTPRPPAPPDIALATNTPPGPTSTPTNTPTATNTATFTPTNTPTATNTPSPTPTPIGPFFYPEGINPLTGLQYPSAAALERRNLIVKISNFPPVVRPQSGVNAADVVYEYEVEGGVTRFAAIYRSNAPEVVGPVRSGRLLDIELVTMHESLFAYSGASGPVQELILGQDWRFQVISPSIGDNCEEAGFCRIERPGIAFEHTLFVDTNKVWERATARGINQGFRAKGFAFEREVPEGGVPANDIFVDWYGQISARWQYDTDTDRYLRYTDSVPHFDAADGDQIWTNNLVIIEVEHIDRPDLFESGASNASIEIDLNDQGRAILIRDGQAYQGFWRRPDNDPGTALQLIAGDGTPLKMRPGRTWVSVVRWLGDTTITEDQVDAMATAESVIASYTPTFTLTPTITPTFTPTSTSTITPTTAP
jgi:hypothetical protein